MYRVNAAARILAVAPTWRARVDASLDRYLPLGGTLAIAAVLCVLLDLGPPGFAPEAPWWHAGFGIVGMGVLAIASIVSIPLPALAVTDACRARHRWRDHPEDVIIPLTFTAWVVLVWIATALFVWAASGWDDRAGQTRDPLYLRTVASCRVVAMNDGWICLPPDDQLVWCLPNDRRDLRLGRTYTNKCRE